MSLLMQKMAPLKHFLYKNGKTFILTILTVYLIHILLRYKFQPIQRYKALSAEEAEMEFSKRNKHLNYFSLMLRKRLKGEDDHDLDEGEEKSKKSSSKKVKELKISEMDEWMDSSDDDSSDNEDKKEEEEEADKKKKGKKGNKNCFKCIINYTFFSSRPIRHGITEFAHHYEIPHLMYLKKT